MATGQIIVNLELLPPYVGVLSKILALRTIYLVSKNNLPIRHFEDSKYDFIIVL